MTLHSHCIITTLIVLLLVQCHVKLQNEAFSSSTYRVIQKRKPPSFPHKFINGGRGAAGSLIITLLQTNCRAWRRKNFENQSTFDEVVTKTCRLTFLDHMCISLSLSLGSSSVLHNRTWQQQLNSRDGILVAEITTTTNDQQCSNIKLRTGFCRALHSSKS